MKLYRVLGREGKITIPHAMRQHIGFGESDIVSFELVSRDAVLVRRERILSRDGVPIDTDMPSLKDFLEGLSEEEAISGLGTVEQIIDQIADETPLAKLVKKKIKNRRRLRAWEGYRRRPQKGVCKRAKDSF